MADPSAFVIEELAGERRTLELRGRALPYADLTLEGKMRADFTWYPGNPTATVQMLGAEEAPTTVTGMWKDRFIRSTDFFGSRAETPAAVALWNGQQVEDALALTRAVDQIRLGGQLLRVTWDEQVREGVLVRFRQRWKRREDVEWEMEFQWSSRGEPKQPVTFVVVPTVDDLAARLRERVNTLLGLAEPVFQARDFFMRALERNLLDIESAAFDVEVAAQQVDLTLASPEAAARRVLAAAESVKGSAAGIVELVDAQPTREIENVADTSEQGLGRALFVDSWARDLRREARRLELLTAEEVDRLRALIDDDDLIAAFVARADSDLREVAQTYYGDQSEWRRLRRYNRLRSSRLIAGDLVLVPKLVRGDRDA